MIVSRMDFTQYKVFIEDFESSLRKVQLFNELVFRKISTSTSFEQFRRRLLYEKP